MKNENVRVHKIMQALHRKIQGVPKKRTPWFTLTITLVNIDRF